MILRFVMADRERWALWGPVGLGLGIALYFSLPQEPPWWSAASVFTAACGIARIAWKKAWPSALVGAIGVCFICLGFVAIQIKTTVVSAPILTRDTGPVRVEGTLVSVETLSSGYRLWLEDVRIARLSPKNSPWGVRIRWSGSKGPPPSLGSRISLLSVLSPPSEPSEPGAFDFRRHAFFQRIGAIGYALSSPDVVRPPPETIFAQAQKAFEHLRQYVAERIKSNVQQPEQGILHALMTGEQTAIPKDTMEAMRISGLTHLLSISGMHIGMVAGAVFFLIRAVGALIPSVALRYPLKKWAAFAAILAAFSYTVLVESPVPAIRSALMSGVVLLAIIVDRNALSMRVLAFAAGVILLLFPDSLLSISFQMSFAAVMVLVAGYEFFKKDISTWGQKPQWWARPALYLGGVIFTSVLATVATLPFSIYHFQQMTFYGLATNMLAVPITGFIVMPSILAAYVLMPFGLDMWALKIAQYGVAMIVYIAQLATHLPGGIWRIPALPDWAFASVILGGLWVCLWKSAWRLGGVVPIVIGFLSLFFIARPDVLISSDGRLWAVRDQDNRLFLSSKTINKFDAGVWEQRDGGPKAPSVWPLHGRSKDGHLTCDSMGCIYQGPKTIAFLRNRNALEDCYESDIVVTSERIKECSAPLVIDAQDLRRYGAHALYFSPKEVVVRTVRAEAEWRPWYGRSYSIGP